MKKTTINDLKRKIVSLKANRDDWIEETKFREEESEVWKNAYRQLKRKLAGEELTK